MKLLIIYSETEVITVSNYIEGTAIVTPHSYLVAEKSPALVMLSALGIDTSELEEFENEDV